MPRPLTIRFNISGQAMNVITGSDLFKHPDRYDPGCQYAKEAAEALRYTDVIRRGRGKTHEVVMSPEAANVIQSYCDTTGKLLKTQAELADRRDGDALLLVADRIMWKLRELAHEAG